MGAAEPQTDRELLIRLNGQIENLSKSIENFSETLKHLEESKIADMQRQISDLQNWKLQIQGGWKFAVIIWTVLTAGIVGIFKAFF